MTTKTKPDTVHILIRCAPELRGAYEQRARESGCTLSHEVRRALIRDVVHHPEGLVDDQPLTGSPHM